jgi:hypothetical protein
MPLKFLPKYPFSPAHQKALQELLALLPERFRKLDTYVSQVPEAEWTHAAFRGFTDTSGNVLLKANQWWRIRGLAIHELGHAARYRLINPQQWAGWEQFWAKNKKQMGTAYGEQNAEEGFAEAVVGTYRPGLSGYKPIPSAVAAEVRRLLG